MQLYSYICLLFGLAMFISFFTRKLNENIQTTIAITASALVGSLLILTFGSLGWFNVDKLAISIFEQLDFKSFLLNGMLGFLLLPVHLGLNYH